MEINEDIRFQRLVWKVQRAGWVLLALAVMAALLGVFGHGLLSTATTTNQPGLLRVEYERVDRFDTPSILRLHIGAGFRHDGRLRVEFDHHYLSHIQIQEITPGPIAGESTAEGTVFTFRTVEPNQPAMITFLVKIQQIGFLSGHIRVQGDPPLTFRHFIYP